MALPKHKVSKSKRDMRRTHKKIAATNVVSCPKCGEYKLPHNACPECGTYDGRIVIETKDEDVQQRALSDFISYKALQKGKFFHNG